MNINFSCKPKILSGLNKCNFQTNPNFSGVKFKPVQDSFECNSIEKFYSKFKNKLKSLVTDKNGNFIYRHSDEKKWVPIKKGTEHLYDCYMEDNGILYAEKVVSKGKECKFNFDKEFITLDENLGILEHGTSEELFNKIKKEGFKFSNDNFAETFHGVYLTRKADGTNNYGEKQLQCKLNGKTAVGNVNYISEFIYQPTAIDDFIEKNNLKFSASKLKEMLLKDEFKDRGFNALYSNKTTTFSKCKPVVVFNPKDIEILN